MTERPILFSAPMVRALLDGSKTQTRRVVKPHPPEGAVSLSTYYHPDPRPHFLASDGYAFMDFAVPCPYGQPGDRLWVRETFQKWPDGHAYRADYQDIELADAVHAPWKPSIHMPRVASRIDLEVTGVRVERLQDISEDDALAEGVNVHPDHHGKPITSIYSPVQAYQDLWESINGPGSWDANPWVWVVEFKVVKP